jgi:hypothetical protein
MKGGLEERQGGEVDGGCEREKLSQGRELWQGIE